MSIANNSSGFESIFHYMIRNGEAFNFDEKSSAPRHGSAMFSSELTAVPNTQYKYKNQDIFRGDIYHSSCFVEYPHNAIASCEFKPFWFKNQAQRSMHL